MSIIQRADFGEAFHWGVSSSAYQTEGAFNKDGKGLSIWDVFTQKKRNVKGGQNARVSADFYHRYAEDFALMKSLSIENFRFSLSWPRILPNGTGKPNQKGLDFYDRLIDSCLEMGIEPWVTLYHWDLPHALQLKGGWVNRDSINWLSEFAELTAKRYGDRVTHWMVLNEPAAFIGLGYFLGKHAPGLKGLKNFLPAMHHVCLSQAIVGQLLRSISNDFHLGTTFSFSAVDSFSEKVRDQNTAIRVDALLNRLFLEPLLGLGYPSITLPFLNRLEKYMKPDDLEELAFNFDFIGVQNYSREVVAHAWLTPLVYAKLISPKKRKVKETAMGWEFYTKGIYNVMKMLKKYSNLPELIITETGIALDDHLNQYGKVNDIQRIAFLKESIAYVRKAQLEGVDVKGYFNWSLTDNFEWAEGYAPRFGLIHINYENLQRTPKSSSHFYRDFLNQQTSIPQI